MAVQGLSPNEITRRSVANLGTYEIEVIITPEPTPSYSGGGGFSRPLPRLFRITVRVRFNGKTYEDTKVVDEKRARVIANLKGIKSFSMDSAMVSVNGIQIFEQEEITIKVTRK